MSSHQKAVEKIIAGLAIAISSSSFLVASSVAQELANVPTESIKKLLTGDMSEPEISELFSEEFLSKAPAIQVQDIFRELKKKAGKCTPIARTPGATPNTYGYLLKCERGYTPMEISFEPSPSRKINGLYIRPTYTEKLGEIKVLDGLFYPEEAQLQSRKIGCKITNSTDLLTWLANTPPLPDDGNEILFHLEEQPREIGYQQYVLPNPPRVVDYGSHKFPAKLAVRCDL